MKTRLISLDYQVPQCDTDLRTFPVVIGHAPDAAIRLDDHSIADHHCQITSDDDGLVVTDLESVHGTFVNGCRITDSILRAGDELGVGMMTFLVQVEQEVEVIRRTSAKATKRANCLQESSVGATA
jgi:pSer/pThr/pTyr-binding forkhead associated (FHA) protein